jgi:hypothetical protein
MTVPCDLTIVATGYVAYSILVLPVVAIMLWYLGRAQEKKKVGRTQV